MLLNLLSNVSSMNECYGRKFILDGEIMDAMSFDNALVYEGNSVYEVIRMVRGHPVFFNDHIERLEASSRHIDQKVLADIGTIRRDVIRLVKTGKKKDINLKIVFNYNEGTGHYLIYFIEPLYPTAEQYRSGVKGILFYAERKDPESKVINHRLRSSIYHKLILESGYEALLVNEENCITEGSRSNIFFLKDDLLVTAPDDKILNGITRKYILDICREHRMKVKFECVNVKDLESYEAAFMTGTSPMVLQFCSIDEKYFNVKIPLIERLRELYIERSEESIARFITETGYRE